MNTHPQILVLKNLLKLLEQLPQGLYTKRLSVIANGTIGEHVRHIIEFYQCCLNTASDGSLNYSLRKRDNELETDLKKGIHKTKEIIEQLNNTLLSSDLTIVLHTASTSKASSYQKVESSLSRELVYCMDHCIHHQFIIRAALIALHHEHILPENFGVAFSTIEYRDQCVS